MRCFRKAVALWLCCALLGGLLPSGKAEGEKRLALALDEATMIFTVTDGSTGRALSSALTDVDASVNRQWSNFLRSTVAIEYAAPDASTTARTDLFSAEAAWEITRTEAGFRAEIDFTGCQIALTLETALTEDGFTMTVPWESIREYGENLLCGVYLAPALGATLRDETPGYMLVPDGPGAIIAYSDGNIDTNAPYARQIYGGNAGITEMAADRADYPPAKEEAVLAAPVYGFAQTERGLAALCILESGQDNAFLYAYAAGIITPYNFVMSAFTVRDKYFKLNSSTRGSMIYETEPQKRDLKLRVCLLTGDQANYSRMALRYRQYLMEEKGLVPREAAPALRLDFLGAETEKAMLWNNTVPVTTVAQMGGILEEAEQAGLPGILACYWGWQPGGMTQSNGGSADKMEKALGTLEDWRALAAVQRERGGGALLAQDLLHAFSGRTYGRDALARKINLQMITVPTHQKTYPSQFILAPGRAAEAAQNLARLTEGEPLAIALSGVTDSLFSYAVNSQSQYARFETAAQYAALMEQLAAPALVRPLAEYWPYAGCFLDFPLETTAYTILTAAVPFLPMALGGLLPLYSERLNAYEDENYLLLKLAEYGVRPSWIITYADGSVLRDTNSASLYSTGWAYYLPRIQAVMAKLAELEQWTAGSRVVSHCWRTAQIVELQYENGFSLYLNYAAVPGEIDGTVIPGMSWQPKGGDAK